ncbi:MAG: flagellar hook-length control protein FliK [Armatimonadota bacterium]|nr:flagellar hook-length control protein FliK [Armatimonadota bacterium]
MPRGQPDSIGKDDVQSAPPFELIVAHLMGGSDAVVETDEERAGQQVPDVGNGESESAGQLSKTMDASLQIEFLLGSFREAVGEAVPLGSEEDKTLVFDAKQDWMLPKMLGGASSLTSEKPVSVLLSKTASLSTPTQLAPDAARLPSGTEIAMDRAAGELAAIQPTSWSSIADVRRLSNLPDGIQVRDGKVTPQLSSSKSDSRDALLEMLGPKLTLTYSATRSLQLDGSAMLESVPIFLQTGQARELVAFMNTHSDTIERTNLASQSNNASQARTVFAEAGTMPLVKPLVVHESALAAAFSNVQSTAESATPGSSTARSKEDKVVGHAPKGMLVDAQILDEQALISPSKQENRIVAESMMMDAFQDSKDESAIFSKEVTDKQKDGVVGQAAREVPTGVNIQGDQLVRPFERLDGHVPPEPLLRAHIIHQIVRAARMHVSDSTADITLRLDPPNLGVVHLNVVAERGMVTANIRVGTEAVRQALEADLSMLRESLTNAGIHVDAISVTIGDDMTPGWDWQLGEHGNARNYSAQTSGNHAAISRESDIETIQDGMRAVSVGRFDYLA